MAYETKEKSGSLFRNENKERENQPDYTGNIKINGKLWRVAGWDTESRGGIEYISLRISDPDDFKRREDPVPASQGQRRRMTEEEFQAERARRQQQYRPNLADDIADDDIPF